MCAAPGTAGQRKLFVTRHQHLRDGHGGRRAARSRAACKFDHDQHVATRHDLVDGGELDFVARGASLRCIGKKDEDLFVVATLHPRFARGFCAVDAFLDLFYVEVAAGRVDVVSLVDEDLRCMRNG